MKKAFSVIFFPLTWFFRKIGDLFYAFSVWLNAKIRKRWPKKPSTLKADGIKDLIFYIGLISFPLVMFVFTKIYINAAGMFLGFVEYEEFTNKVLGINFKTFERLFEHLATPRMGEMFKLSLISWSISLIVSNIIPITFSFYVYKKYLGHSVFKVLLFLPTLFASMITVSIFKMIANCVIPEIFGSAPLLSAKKSTGEQIFTTLLIYNLWSGLGGGLLTHLALMNAIDPSISESAQLDGVGFYGELWHIVLPSCYRVLALGLVTSWSGIFTGSLNLFAYFGKVEPDGATLPGHHFYLITLDAALNNDYYQYSFLSAWGLLITAICTPLTLICRRLINKYGPSEE
ncbi:MAG: sugar ABC transporter permease [Clostridiales bacterium]|nr:sugar ABC transporter permease [Clostridiales bacterium]